MRPLNIRVVTGHQGIRQLKASFRKNWRHYLREALGLGIFMFSACTCKALLWGDAPGFHLTTGSEWHRSLLMGLLMGLTALSIFYAPITARSGSHTNPAVTLTFMRLGKMCPYDTTFFILAQFIGGTLGVMMASAWLGKLVSDPPVSYAITVPGVYGVIPAALLEYLMALTTMTIVLWTSGQVRLKKYTRVFSACLICCWVILAGPVSGFSMNPARSFSSAFPSGIYTSFWIYLLMPLAGMLSAAEIHLRMGRLKSLAAGGV